MLMLLASIVVCAVLSPLAVAKKQSTSDEAVAAIRQFQNDGAKADPDDPIHRIENGKIAEGLLAESLGFFQQARRTP